MIKELNAQPADFYYGPWADLATAKVNCPIGIRYDGLTVKIVGAGEYWWLAADLSDSGLVAKSIGTGINILSATDTFDYGSEQDTVVKTVTSALITNANIKSFTAIPLETVATSLDDFKLNGVVFNIENIIDNTSFDIRGTAQEGASGVYTINYKITY